MTSSENKLTAEQEKFLERSVLSRHRTMFARSFAGTASPRMAIKAFCLNCCGNDTIAAANCAVATCPLWSYNGYRLGYRMGRSEVGTCKGEDVTED